MNKAVVGLTTGQAADRLGVSPNTFKKMAATGLLPVLDRRGNRTLAPAADVDALARRDAVDVTGLGLAELPVLRVGPAHEAGSDDPDGREWLGYGVSLSHEQRLAALRGWWRCDPHRVMRAGVMAVTVGPYVVAVLAGFSDADSDDEGRWRFETRLGGCVEDLVTPVQTICPGAPHVDMTRLLLGRRLESESGGPVAYAGAAGGR